ncbi:iron-sulfur cluster insertion protein ErpA [Sodalis-like secondary symbiont of Drepanosiphum platanoidis]|uniref:iron-sulfur cluster insertion protein ErpA n=1 Tax=Sodalis-like secondary symbiont of Drepanosiphum platanoidis TaxID=2994493 RepID=UPI003464D531
MKKKTKNLLNCTNSAILRIKQLIFLKKKSNLNLRIYITGGGCNGFKYKFLLDKEIKKNDLFFNYMGARFIIDPISIQYIKGGFLDYKEELKGSRFILINPKAKNTCSCGSSFNI